MNSCRFLLMLSRKEDDGSHRSGGGERSAPRALEAGYREGQDIYPRWQGLRRSPSTGRTEPTHTKAGQT